MSPTGNPAGQIPDQKAIPMNANEIGLREVTTEEL